MADNLSLRISELQQFMTKTYSTLLASKKCDGCLFLDKIRNADSEIDDDDDVDSIISFRQSKADLARAQFLISKAAECKRISIIDNSEFSKSSIKKIDQEAENQNIVSTNSVSKDQFTQTLFVTRRVDASSQTTENCNGKLESKIGPELDDYCRQIDLFSARRSLEQLYKFSATEKERENLIAKNQFLKLFLQLTDQEFQIYYTKYLNGISIDELRQQFASSKLDKKGDGEIQKLESELEKADVELESLRKKCAAESEKVAMLSGQLNSTKQLMQQMVKFLVDTVEIESSEQEGVASFLSTVSEFTDVLNGRRKSY